VRDVATSRFAYPDTQGGFVGSGMYAPRVDRLRRTFRTGLVFDFYSPFVYTSGTEVRLTVLGRLVRLDDESVLWARTCRFEASISRVALATPEPHVEDVLAAAALGEADRCATELAAHFLAGPER
jgi:hypothetical protein